MKRNPLIPYAVIAIIGILAIVIVSGMGVGQREALQAEANGETAEGQEGAVAGDPEAIYESNCAACHGADLSGGMGPGLTNVGSKLTADEIAEIIQKGLGDMPPQQVADEERTALAEWLGEKK